MLKLQNSSIYTVDEQALNGPMYLVQLDISDNPISYLSNMTFTMLHQLQYLNLSYTSVTYISGEMFMYNSKLTHLDLSNSRLETLTSMSLVGLDILRVLLLSHTRINCLHLQISTSGPACLP